MYIVAIQNVVLINIVFYKLWHLTVFIRIVATATINFSLAKVWLLLIEGSSYSRTAFIYFGGIPLR